MLPAGLHILRFLACWLGLPGSSATAPLEVTASLLGLHPAPHLVPLDLPPNPPLLWLPLLSLLCRLCLSPTPLKLGFLGAVSGLLFSPAHLGPLRPSASIRFPKTHVPSQDPPS